MNITPQFLNTPAYLKFRRRIGDGSMEYLVRLGLHCQQSKSSTVALYDDEDVELTLGIDSGGKAILDALSDLKMASMGEEGLTCYFFEDMNRQLLSNWKNGELKSIQSKANKTNSKQSNSNQPYATPLPKQCSSNASDLTEAW